MKSTGLTEKFPASRSARLEAASLLAERGDDERALHHLENAQACSPNDPLVLDALADTLANLERNDELASVLERRASAATNEPETRATALAELGELYQGRLADPEAARDAFERASDPDRTRAEIDRGTDASMALIQGLGVLGMFEPAGITPARQRQLVREHLNRWIAPAGSDRRAGS